MSCDRCIVGLKEKKNKFGTEETLELIHDGQSAMRFKNLVAGIARLQQQHKSDTNFGATEDPSALSHVLSEAADWYRAQLSPNDKFVCPLLIEQSEPYQYAAIDSVLEKAVELQIDPQAEPYLMWIPRMGLCLSLPPFWRRENVGGTACYYNIQYDVLVTSHPASGFLAAYADQVRDWVKAQDACSVLSINPRK